MTDLAQTTTMAATAVVSEEILERVRRELGKVRVPTDQDRVWKDECAFSYENAFSKDGVFVSLQTWIAYSKSYLGLATQRPGSCGLFLRVRSEKKAVGDGPDDAQGKPSSMEADKAGGPDRVTEFALGTENGFKLDTQKYKVENDFSTCSWTFSASGSSRLS